MNLSIIAGCIWVFVGAITAMLPMRGQMVPGSILLLSAPVIMVWIGYQNGWIWTAIGVAAFASMMRNPLRYLIGRARGKAPELPPELRR